MPAQTEIPGTESPNRNPELHALGLELYDLQSQRMQLTKDEKAKRQEIATVMHRLEMTEYEVDGVALWLEPGAEKVKVKMGSREEDEE